MSFEFGINCGSQFTDIINLYLLEVVGRGSGKQFQVGKKLNFMIVFKFDINCDSNCTDLNNFYSLKVVGRGSETQFQMGKNINFMM